MSGAGGCVPNYTELSTFGSFAYFGSFEPLLKAQGLKVVPNGLFGLSLCKGTSGWGGR